MDQLTSNIEQVAHQLQQIKAEAYRQQNRRELARGTGQRPSLRKMRQNAWINTRWHIAWPHWPPGVVAKITAVYQKIVRRLLQWYIDPIIQQQNEFNQATLQAVELLSREIVELRALAQTTTAQQAHLKTLTTQVENLQKTVAANKTESINESSLP